MNVAEATTDEYACQTEGVVMNARERAVMKAEAFFAQAAPEEATDE